MNFYEPNGTAEFPSGSIVVIILNDIFLQVNGGPSTFNKYLDTALSNRLNEAVRITFVWDNQQLASRGRRR